MLPKLLCEELCSLNPMRDRLTFSVMWKVTPEGKVSRAAKQASCSSVPPQWPDPNLANRVVKMPPHNCQLDSKGLAGEQ